MSDFYTITGKHTGNAYLVLADSGRLTMFPPGTFTLPWVGASGQPYGLSYSPRCAIDLPGPPWIAGRMAQREVNRREGRAAREYRKRQRALRYAQRRRQR